MRLSDKQLQAIKTACSNHIHHTQALYLYGSRLDDAHLGGDIDLLLRVPEVHIDECLALKYKILRDIKQSIGDQKIDLTIVSFDSKDPFVLEVLPRAIKIGP